MTVFSGVFPPIENSFSEKEDAKHFGVDTDDNTIRAKTEGGYEFTRKRFTRKPRKTFTTGFTLLSQADYETLMEFWEEYQGAKAFNWVDPTNSLPYSVRFLEKPSFVYRGMGATFLWDIVVKLKQV